ncbi:MAG: helix-turn-helix domain-containing protein [Tannerella sp.]|nr:helix-turn-helix domain-containing protein [Tannerella sp.]
MFLQQSDENNTVFEMATTFVNETSEHVFLTGKAGTGKTTFLRYIRRHTHKHAVVAAPTGVAAINAGGVTLHSLFQLPFEPYVPGYSTQRNKFRFSKAKLDMLRQLELLIIDEVSMLRADTLDAIDRTLRIIRRNENPFGGLQILYIGDMFQLPPVVKEEEWALLQPCYESAFFFHAQVIRQTQPVYLELKKVYRQREQAFVDLLNNVRNNCLSAADLERLNTRFRPNFSPSPEDKYITLTTHNYKADRLNRQELDRLAGREHVFTGKVEGEFPDYALPTDLQLCLKADAQVMFIKNDPDGRYFNGKIARVSSISDEQIQVCMPESGEVIQVPKERWKNIRYLLDRESGEMREEEIGAYTQYPLRLAWAVTIHKSQGLTFDRAIVDIGASFAAGQAYVALSRCTSLDGIVLRTRVSPDSVMTDPHAVDFSKTEKSETELRRLLVDGRRKFWQQRLLLYFDWKPMFSFLREFDRLLEGKTSEEFEPARKLYEDFWPAVREMNEVAEKFRRQLLALTEQEQSTGDLDALRDRCQKAVRYFFLQTGERILAPLQNFITHSKLPRQAKTFRKNIIELESDVKLFLENMKRVRYNNVPLVGDMDIALPVRQDVFTSAGTAPPESDTVPGRKRGPAERRPKIDTRRMTLALFGSGLSIEEIAAQRNLAVSTVESHLATFIGKEIAVDRFFTPAELEELGTVIRPLLEQEKPSFKAAYDRLGGKYSYGRLHLAFGYLKQK